MLFIFEKTSQKLGICTLVCGIPNFSLLFSLRQEGISILARIDRRFVGGSRKTFEKVLSKLSKQKAKL